METNDPEKQKLRLKISGQVEKFVRITPTQLRLNGEIGQEITGEIVISPLEKHPFKLLEAGLQKGQDAIASFVERQGGETGTEYVVTIINTRTTAGRYYDSLQLKTDSTERPELTVRVYGNLKDPVAVKSTGSSKVQ